MSNPGTLLDRLHRYYRRKSIQFMIAISFTLVAVGSMVMMSILLYTQFAGNLRQTVLNENRQLVNQIALNINSYNQNMRGIADSMYYKVIKNVDLDEENLNDEMSLLHEANSSTLVSIAAFTQSGELVAAAPVANLKENLDVTGQEWFVRANSIIENPHFSTPHVQNLFSENNQRHSWVISLSRMVELTRGGTTSRGVLLVDMNYSGIELIFQQMGADTAGYVYLIDKFGEIIYHPRQKLIYSGLYEENNLVAAGYADGIHEESFAGAGRQIIVKTASYTGWKIVSVVPNSEFNVSFANMRILMVAIVGITIFLLIVVNAFVSSRVSSPIKRLDASVKGLETGNLESVDIVVDGPYEIAHLGRTIRTTVEEMRRLMDEVVTEQENKRKSEFAALQAQINPHFLYNTLDSIVWMVEDERYPEAISMVTALASLFRISLSRGNTIIPIGTELQHAGYYLHIQNIRYRNKFRVEYHIDEAIRACYIIKLVVQPLLENTIYHAMEMMDGDGVIRINGYMKDGDVYIEVADNGLGMTADKVAGLLAGPSESGKKGLGIGLKNVHQRIQLYYGPQYGLEIESVLDEGTCVRIHLPADRTGPGKEADSP